MCEHVTTIISGLLIPRYHRHIPEVPRASQNDHADMLFLMKTGKMFVVEYKLSNPKALLRQVQRNDMTIGIINQPIKKEYRENRDFYWKRIFTYTGQDWEIERIAEFLIYKYTSYPKDKFRIFGNDYKKCKLGIEAIYYWGYKETDSSLIGGIKSGKRLSLYQLYIQAIWNLQKAYNWTLDSYLVHSVLVFYAASTAKKHFKTAMDVKN